MIFLSLQRSWGSVNLTPAQYPIGSNKALPPQCKYTSDMIIDRHTLFPLYVPFLPFKRACALRQRMKAHSTAVVWIAGITTSKVSRVQQLRYCPLCVEYDRLTYGECYWHRVHQVPGVLVCPIHEVMLEDSAVNMVRAFNAAQFCSAECSVVGVSHRKVLTHLSTTALLQLARNVQYLLEQPISIEQEYVQQHYRDLLAERGFFTVSGKMRYAKLREALLNYYPPHILEDLECDITESKENWLARWTMMRHPLHHLLFIQFLCETSLEFFTKSCNQPAPFGDGPWPCLNPLCLHFEESIITSYTVRQGSCHPIATFACRCGFTYSRRPSTDDRTFSRIGNRVLQYGDVWDQHLTTYWLDESITTSQIAPLMHTDVQTVRRQAARLGLPFAPHRGKRPKIYQDDVKKRRDVYRALWEEVLKAHSESVGIRKVVKAAPKPYAWLWRYDREWLKEHYPTADLSQRNERLTLSKTQLRYEKFSSVDAELAELVRKTVEEICAKSEFPIQITRQVLIAQVGHSTLLKKPNAADILPLTTHVLNEVLETSTVFVWRKLRWSVRACLVEQITPSYHEFVEIAHIGEATSTRPFIKPLIQIAYSNLSTGTLLSDQMPQELMEEEKGAINEEENGTEIMSGSLASVCMDKQFMLPNAIIRPARQIYSLIPILLLVVAALVSGSETYSEIANWGYQNGALLSVLGIPEGKFPGHSVLKKICVKVNIDSFEEVLDTWLYETFPLARNEADGMKEYTRSKYVPGLRLLRPYQHIASEIVAKLH